MQERTDTPANALWTAAHHGDQETVRRLIEQGVDVNVWDRHGRTALSLAAAGNRLAVAKELIAAGAWVDPHEEGDTCMTPLMCAAEHGHHQMVVLLLRHGADPTRHGGVSIATADYYARGATPERKALSALLQTAEDEWRKRQGSDWVAATLGPTGADY